MVHGEPYIWNYDSEKRGLDETFTIKGRYSHFTKKYELTIRKHGKGRTTKGDKIMSISIPACDLENYLRILKCQYSKEELL